ncbi:5-formyltetrahydrofolate cyclo-ligase [Clostridium sp. ZS2-4]|uniref:5-formyltetrahydrofolate cyclo-ligase n=1 Tax=Clostridium sp. ZS2-4 TaxID=2987703 RepID=UPI00227BCDF4|nr:5-formyltetrahydrofolate cyclo-ligase [Clostridium sp. ZS2-4]MCY6356491.1 5-formyltetrahydrofolate cyclo-ligase [Clostridium sp. ZS2-4]
MKSKKEIREYINEKRLLLKAEEKLEFDTLIFNKLINSKEYIDSKHIFTYVSFNNEVDTQRFIQHALQDDKCVYVPKVISKQKGMKAIQIKSVNELKKGMYGIWEPASFEFSVDEQVIDLVVVPGIAFDIFGGRVGYGGGFYDRFLKKLNSNAVKLALAYDFQVMDKVPVEIHDVFIDRIITN